MTSKDGQDDREAGHTGAAAKNELFEAIDHFKKAAGILFDRAAKDPTVKTAAEEAERVFKKLGDTAEPLARQLTDELGKLTQRISDTVSETVASRRKSKPPAPGKDADDAGAEEER